MKKLPRLVAALTAVTALLGLSGCATVSVQAAVIDDSNAVFNIQEVISKDGFIEYLQRLPGRLEQLNKDSVITEIPDLQGTWKQPTSIEGVSQSLEIQNDQVRIYSLNADGSRSLYWAGKYTAPSQPTSNHTWNSEVLQNERGSLQDQTDETILFSYSQGEIFYIAKDANGEDRAIWFVADSASVPTPTETPGESPVAPIPTDDESLCALFKENVGDMLQTPAEVVPQIECTDVDFAVTTSYQVGYDYRGIVELAGKPIQKGEANLLPFRFYHDPVYGDVVFEHKIVGTNNPLLGNSQEWLDIVKDYRVSISFPGAVTAISNDGVQPTPETGSWDYEAIKNAVAVGDYTLNAAGRADAKVNPVPIFASIGGVLFLLLLVVYFMWKRFQPKTIAITSFILASLSPFGLALGIVAKRKSRNNADGAALATAAIVVSAALFVFEALVVILFIIMAPQIVTDILSSLGIASSAA